MRPEPQSSPAPAPRATLRDGLNALGFALRSRLRWSRAGYRESPDCGQRLRTDEARLLDSPRAHALIAKYGLARYRTQLAPRSWQINLTYADLLDQALVTELGAATDGIGPCLRVLDVGSKNFEYAPALHAVLACASGAAALTGIELDAWRVYANLHSRWDAAQYMLGLLPPAEPAHRYLAGDLLAAPLPPGGFDCITWFYPLLHAYPLRRWGLPVRHLRPAELLARVRKLAAPGGLVLIVNQTAREARLQTALLRACGWDFTRRRICLTLLPNAPARWIFLARG